MKIQSEGAKAVITAYIMSLSNRQWDQLPSYFTPNATWWVSGNPAHVAKAGLTTAAAHLPELSQLADLFDSYRFDIVDMVGERSTVMLEGRATGRAAPDLLYVNNITMTFEVEEASGKIASLREYPEHVEIEWLLEQLQGLGSNSTKRWMSSRRGLKHGGGNSVRVV
ncbi:hypothetical protein F4778DRAFT_762333 [Xylariomycetidae sp. FL2044]|nr:hypothetical protein F4778DRAFT_762333 [Xylariomycetidae sp. FL2044]